MHSITNFKSLEADKENIKPISQGRSAAKLNEIIHTDSNTLDKQLSLQLSQFEDSLRPEILQELDDPLESYLSYLKWIRESYRTGSNDSLYIQVLERTTHDFKDDSYYKNEVRYFKVWLDYISYSDHPGDVFTYLSKKRIGSELSLFYENYSLFFELNDQWDTAETIYTDGITQKARPYKRLLKSYNDFLQRKEQKLSHIPTTIPVKENKGLKNPDGLGLSSSISAKNVASKKILDSDTLANRSTKNSKKIQIFNDNNENRNEVICNQADTSFAHIDTIKNSKKENVLPSTSWEGQKLKSVTANEKSNKRAKMEIFNDEKNKYPITTPVILPDGTVKEVYDFNLELFIPSDTGSSARSWLDVLLMFNKPIRSNQHEDSTVTTTTTNKRLPSSLFNTPITKKVKTDFSNGDEDKDEVTSPCDKSPGINDTPLLEYFKNSKDGLFSQNNHEGMNKEMFGNANVEGLENNNKPITSNENNKTETESTCEIEKNLLDAIIGDKFNDIFTDTITRTKSLNLKLDEFEKSDLNMNKRTSNDTDALLSSPFVDNPIDKQEKKFENDCINPFDEVLKKQAMSMIEKDLFKDSQLHDFSNLENSKLNILRSIFKPNSNPIYGNRQAMLEFEKDNIFCVTKELGHGDFGTVYLSEKMNGQLNAIKIESPANIWEVYILSKLNSISNDFIKVQGFYRYKDESFLILPYFKQGTILDLVSSSTDQQFVTGKYLIEETIIIYFTIQLITTIIKLHSLNIVHCNIKPENCLLNIQSSCNNNKITFKDIILCDFDKAIDLSFHEANTEFQCEAHKISSNDCYEISNNLPWKYEPDYYGIANVIHLLLFNCPIKTKKHESGKIELVEPIKRYWQIESWNELFSILLNPRSYNSSGLLINELKQIKTKFESWFSLTVDKRLFLNRLRHISEILDTRVKMTNKDTNK